MYGKVQQQRLQAAVAPIPQMLQDYRLVIIDVRPKWLSFTWKHHTCTYLYDAMITQDYKYKQKYLRFVNFTVFITTEDHIEIHVPFRENKQKMAKFHNVSHVGSPSAQWNFLGKSEHKS